MSLATFLNGFGTEDACAEALFRGRSPRGFVCPARVHQDGFVQLRTRRLLQYKHCRHQAALTAGTIFGHSKLPLTTWFLAMYLLTQQKNGISAPELKRHLGVSYTTAWNVKHKLLQVMMEQEADNKLLGIAAMLPRLARAALRTPPMPYRLLKLAEIHW